MVEAWFIHGVEDIYARLVVVEARCVDQRKSAAAREKDLADKQLLHEHYGFFLACQYPSARSILLRLPEEHSMMDRMWQHGIHACFEILRFQLPDSLEHLLAFIHTAYSMMALFYETVPGFRGTWIECLGNYRSFLFMHDKLRLCT